ncbi:unnamed protein product [Phytophthora fragariaefolia]|uniref:Unnamed protein product n=1 Tax=Phytophthora fragariaefolia TaxID=1490495 RepID=A0A9W6XBP1_9STRA|nr:unnamed protein product [Phytophthora fragariaefolia]
MGGFSPMAKLPAKAPEFELMTPPKSPLFETDTDSDTPPSSPHRKSRRKFDFSVRTLQAYSHFRQDHAALLLGVSPITLKRICQRRKYRWPYRTIKAQARRAERLEAQRLQREAALDVRMTPPMSPTTAPELLLRLRDGNAKSFSSSPTSVSTVSSPIYHRDTEPTPMEVSPTAQYPPLDRPMTSPLLPPLSLLLAKHKLQSMTGSPDYHNVHRMRGNRPYHLHRPIDYKSSFYATSYETNAPVFPLRRLAALSLTDRREL